MTEAEEKRAQELFDAYLAVIDRGDFVNAIAIDEEMKNECPISGLTYLASSELCARFYFRSAENPVDFDALEKNLSYFESKPDGYFENEFLKSRCVAGMDNVAYILYIHDDEKLLALNNQNAAALRDAARHSEFNLERANNMLSNSQREKYADLIVKITALTVRVKNLSERTDAVKQKLEAIKEHITELNAQKKAGKTEADRKKNKTARIIRYVLGAVIVVTVLIILLARR